MIAVAEDRGPRVPQRQQTKRGPGVTVIPGRLRHARQVAGLSLSQLAGTFLSRTTIHQYEIGQTRPSANVLEYIAGRLGKPITYFTDTTIGVPEAYDPVMDLIATARRLPRTQATSRYHPAVVRYVVEQLQLLARHLVATQEPPSP